MVSKKRDNPVKPAATASQADDACECRSGPIFGSARVNGATFFGKWLHYADVDGLAMFEGDIVLGSTADLQADDGSGPVEFSVGITGQQFRWPNGRLPYEIDSTLPNQQRVTDAIAHWESRTGIRFVLRTAANAAQFPDFVRFVSGGGCSSQVGRRGGRQDITLGSGCTTGNAIHEIGHTVGLWHEQSREDRDTFVQVLFANIDPAMQHNFNQHVSDGDDLGAYEFGSIMHYPATAFSINGQATIVPRQPLPPGVVMGQRTGLSAGDIAGVGAMYPGLGGTVKEVRKDPISDTTLKETRKDPITDPTVKEIRKDPISDTTLKETRKDPITDPTVKEIRKDPITDPTVKEIRKDPITDVPTRKEAALDHGPFPHGPFPHGSFPIGPGPGPGPLDFGATPFVLASGSRYAVADPLATAAEQVQRLAEAHSEAQQQADALAQAYEVAVADYAALAQQTGSG